MMIQGSSLSIEAGIVFGGTLKLHDGLFALTLRGFYMRGFKSHWKLMLFLLLIVIVGLSIWSFSGDPAYESIDSQSGIWDLRDVDFQVSSARLAGEVEYVPNALLTPEEFEVANGVVLGEIPNRTEYVTSRIRLRMPDNAYYEIAGFADDMGSRIYINGKWMADTGMPATNAEENVPAEQFLCFTVEPVDGVIEIVQQSSNFNFRTNTSHIRWTIGSPESIDRWTAGFTYSYVIDMGIYLALFLVHLLLFIIMPSYRPNLWFGLLCLIWALRTGITSVRPLSTLLPQLDWVTTFRLEYLSVLAALVLIATAYHLIFPGVLPKGLRIFIYSSQGAFALLYIFANPLLMSQTMIFYEIIAAFCAVFALVCLVRKVRKPDTKQKIIIVSLLIILVSLVLDSLYYNKIYLPFIHNVVMETSILVFSLFQMTAMFLGTMEEVAAAKEAEQKLALENAALDRVNRLKTDMMATISHELRTPLAVMMGYAQLAAIELKDRGVDEQTTADLDAMAQESMRLAHLVQEMQNVSLSRSLREGDQTVGVEAVIRQIAQLYRPILERKQTRLNLEIEADLPKVACNPNELTQVLFNLFNNADKHTQNGTVSVSASRQGEMVAVTVSDTGSGIAPEHLPHVFEKYYTGSDGGSGLGLSICQEIIEAYNGAIDIKSSLGQGTEVTFMLPIAAATVEEVEGDDGFQDNSVG